MRYCTKCRRLIEDDNEQKCSVCGRKTISDPSHYSPVKIVTANGFELERIRASLDDADIPYSYQETYRDAGIQILNSAPPENCDVFVPLSAYRDASDVLIGIGALSEGDAAKIDEQTANKAKKAAEDEELPPRKARMIRILSGIGFLLLLALVVWLTDFLFDFVKALFF